MMAEPPRWWPWQCWVCQDSCVDASLEMEVQHSKFGDSAPRPQQRTGPLGGPAETYSSRSTAGPMATGARPESPRDQERVRLRELMKAFVHRGMGGVACEVVDASGRVSTGLYSIDERLSCMSFELPPRSDGEGTEEHGGSPPYHIVPFSLVTEVCRPEDGEGAFGEATLQALDEDRRKRLVKLIYRTETGASNHLCFLEATNTDRQRFITCVRILRRYMDEKADGGPMEM